MKKIICVVLAVVLLCMLFPVSTLADGFSYTVDEVTDTTITLSWTTVSGADGYAVRIQEEGQTIVNQYVFWDGRTTFTFTGRTPGQTYIVNAAFVVGTTAYYSTPTPVQTSGGSDYTYSEDSGNATITGYTGGDAEITIPDSIDGYTVTAIGDDAFSGNTDIVSVTISGSITSIGNSAFQNCSSLSAAHFEGDAPAPFGTNVFDGTASGFTIYYTSGATGWTEPIWNGYPCEEEGGTSDYTYSEDSGNATITGYTGGDTEVTIPDSIDGYTVTAIGDDAFSGNTDIVSVTIPGSITSIGNSAFQNCSGLSAAHFEGDAPAPFGTNVFDGTASGFTIYYTSGATGWTEPTWNGYPCEEEGGTSDYTYSLEGDNAKITAYSGSDTDITVPASIDGHPVISIEEYVFKDKDFIQNVTLSSGIESIGSEVFKGCDGLTTVTIPNTVSTIQGGAFMACTSLGSITIPNSVTFINVYAFSACTSLETVNIGTGLDTISDCMFSECSALQTISLPEGLTSINYGAFGDCSSLTGIDLPDSLLSIGSQAFLNAVLLTNMTLPNDVAEIGESAFQACDGLTSVTIPDSVTSIGQNAFSNCVNLQSLTIGAGMTTISPYVFSSCPSLTSVDIPSGITTIGEGAFSGSALESVTIANGVASIGEEAFKYCTALQSVDIPASVTSMGSNAFQNCFSLSTAHFEGDVPASFGEGVFDSAGDGFTIYYNPGRAGWSTPIWNGYSCMPLGSINGYNANDFGKVQAFLDAPSSISGKTNGQRLNAAYDSADPATWTGVVWDTSEVKRITAVGDSETWNGKSLAGSLDLSGFDSLAFVACSNNQISEISITDDTALLELYCADNGLSLMNTSTNTSLQTLDCSGNAITSLDISANGALETLECQENELTSLALNETSHPLLETVRCNDNNITTLTMDLDHTIGMNCSGNQLASIDLTNCAGFTFFQCADNQLTTIDLADAGIGIFDCSDNQLTTLDFGSATSFEVVCCPRNYLTSLDFGSGIEINGFICSDNNFTTLEMDKVSGLNYFDCRHGTLTSLDLTSNIGLETLICNGNPLLVQIDAHIKGGTISLSKTGDGSVELYSDESSLYAKGVPGASNQFVDWTQRGTQVSTDAVYNLNIGADYVLSANFRNNITDKVVGGKLKRTYYDEEGNIKKIEEYYGADDSTGIQKISYYSNGVRTKYELFDTHGNMKNLVELYGNGNIKKVNYYNTGTGKRYAYKLYDTAGRMTHYIYTYSDGVKPKKTSYYKVSTGKRYAYKLYDTAGRTTHYIFMYNDGINPKKTNYYNVSTGIRKYYKLYDTQGRTTHYAECYSDGVKAKKMNYYNPATGVRTAYKTYRTDGSCSCWVQCNSSGQPYKAMYYDKDGDVTKVVYY